MILTVTLNAALDVTWGVDSLRPRTSHRVDTVHERAGGKGINVARVLGFLGHAPVATGFVGGVTGRLIRDGLRTAGIRDAFLDVTGDSRRTLAVVARDDGDATVFNGRGPHVGPATWRLFSRHYAELLAGVSVVVLSGSTPPGLPADAYAQLIDTASAAGALTILDTSGAALLHALPARPDVIKPNAAEAMEAAGCEDLAQAAAMLRAGGARSVVTSVGADGLYAHTPEGAWRAVPPSDCPETRRAPATPAWRRSRPDWRPDRRGRTSCVPPCRCRRPRSPARPRATSTPPSTAGSSPRSTWRKCVRPALADAATGQRTPSGSRSA